MDRVTRYPIFSNPHSARVTGLALDGDTSYTIELVGVGPDATWNQDDPQVWATDHEARPYKKSSGVSYARQSSPSQLSLGSPNLENDDEEMKAYRLDIYNGLHQPQDLERERWAIIHGQAVRKGGTVVATVGGTLDHGDTGPSSQRQCTLIEESMVDREQIDFLAARQQFLSLEQANVDALPPNPTTRATLTRTPLGVSQIPKASNGIHVARTPLEVRQIPKASNGPHVASTPLGVSQIPKVSNGPHVASTPLGVSQIPKASNGPHVANGYMVPFMSQEKVVVLEEKGLPSGSSIGAVDGPGSQSQAESSEPPKETPIEREIRLAQEREADLREQRGLQRAAGHQELVRIPSRPLLNKVTLTEVPRRDRGRPSLYVQRDMVQETQREEDHRREGLQVGRASTPDWASEDPQLGLRRSPSSDCILGPIPDARAADQAPEIRKVNRIPPDAYQPYLGPRVPQREFSTFGVYSKSSGVATEDSKTMAIPKVTGSPRHLPESSGKPLNTKEECFKPSRGHPRASGGVVQWEYFRLRPLRFRVPDGPQQVETPSHTWGWEVAGAPALRLQRSQSSDLLEREVENVLRREREVAEERRNALFPEVFSPEPDEGWEPDSRSSSQGSGIMGSYSVSESPTFTPIHLHSGLVWRAEAPTDGHTGQNKKGLWYAGINPEDRINSEVLGATRVTRHKNAMAERWEARLYASEDED